MLWLLPTFLLLSPAFLLPPFFLLPLFPCYPFLSMNLGFANLGGDSLVSSVVY